jgi:hypothetical protein
VSDELMSPNAFHWVLIALTGLVAGAWAVYDTRNLVKTRAADLGDPLVRDKRFGYLMGILIGVTGVIGCVAYHVQFVA